MGKPRKVEIFPGDEIGFLTILSEEEKAKSGHRRYRVRCRCGKEYTVLRPTLLHGIPKCVECGRKYSVKSDKGNVCGQRINNWEVLEEVEKNAYGARKFKCRCTSCGSISVKSKRQMEHNKSGRCENCKPDYQFLIDGDVATGVLPDGTEFCISVQDLERVDAKCWRLNSKGYIQTRADDGRNHVHLHQFILGTDISVIVDHINRNTCDCRRENLRIVTAQQNSWNRSLARNNTTGYVGVSLIKSKKLYRAQISIHERDIGLGRSKDPVVCAQMYNIASDFLFGEYKGHVNDVPDPPLELIQKIHERCRPFRDDKALAALDLCGHFLLEGTA